MNIGMKSTGIAIILMLFLVGLSVIVPQEQPGQEFIEMPRFESYEALEAAFAEAQAKGYNRGIVMETLGAVTMMTADAVSSMPPAKGGYSETNVQVQGVDEADIVKTDGKYIYLLSAGKELVITDAYPIGQAEIISRTDLGEINPKELFIMEDKLLVFSHKYDNGSESRHYNTGYVVAQLYNIENKSSPALEKELEFEGSYLTSRLIGENAYFVVNNYPRHYGCEEVNCLIPLMVENGERKQVAEVTDIAYLPPMPAESFITIVSLNMETGEMQKETVVGSASAVYASSNSIYLAGTVWSAPDMPIFRNEVEAIVGSVQQTTVNKFGLKNGAIGFLGQGTVPGNVLNQFSMDEFAGNFRIATTARTGFGTSNNIYVLDGEMERIGTLENLAPGESIYSARFMSEKAYLVTFKKVDPLFVIDMADPTNPRVLGKLKIPGYSDYLHPIDETHIIGIGKDAVESGYGDFVWYQGIKMAIFDVSDVSNPIEMHKVIIGDRGTDSYALRDHKAFLYDKEKELLVIPVLLAEISEEQKQQNPPENGVVDAQVAAPSIVASPPIRVDPGYGEQTFQGAFVYRLTLENGFEERGRITHVTTEGELKRGYYYGDEYSIKRSLYIRGVLYTISGRTMKANSLETLEEIKEFTFG